MNQYKVLFLKNNYHNSLLCLNLCWSFSCLVEQLEHDGKELAVLGIIVDAGLDKDNSNMREHHNNVQLVQTFF